MSRVEDALKVLAPPHATRDYRPEDQAADVIRKAVRALRAGLEEIVALNADDHDPGFEASPDYYTGVGTAARIAADALSEGTP